MSRQLETQLRLIAAQAQSLADKASTGSYWSGEMTDGLRVIREALDSAGREVSAQRSGDR
ncbi:hypothetical protein AB4071_02980 [Stenotrophomonas sp. 2MCAF14_2]|uniref:hypothetical protein n=1 Tax=Stenotrophomonas sp. 2MCAF14_2 TaxID=3232983 RepID=UPI003F9C2981